MWFVQLSSEKMEMVLKSTARLVFSVLSILLDFLREKMELANS